MIAKELFEMLFIHTYCFSRTLDNNPATTLISVLYKNPKEKERVAVSGFAIGSFLKEVVCLYFNRVEDQI